MTLKNSILSLVLLSCLLWLPATGMAAEIMDTELTRLEQIFQQLAVNNEALLSELTISKQDLAQARQKLGESQQVLTMLQKQLLVLKTESVTARGELEQAQNSLQSTNKSLQVYENEMRRERSRLRLQRDIGFVLLIFSFVRQS